MVKLLGKLRGPVVVAAAIAGVAGCAGTGNVNTSVSGSNGFQFGDNGVLIYKVGHRATVGDVAGKTLQGQPLSLASYRGKYVVVDFWSQDCSPCHSEEPALEALSQEYAHQGVQFVGIDERDNLAAGQAFEREFNVTYPSLFDRDDAYVLDFPGAAPPSTPTTVIIDPHGGIAARVSGELDYTHMKELIDDVRSESV
jgi:thiol-disulfide isomerase/thioredoxin